jgi:hypothetical protein
MSSSRAKGLIPPVTLCVNYVNPDTVFKLLPELTLRSLIRFTVTYVVKYSISRRYKDISALILEVGFVMNEVVMRIGLNSVEVYTCSLITFFIYSLIHLANIPVMNNGFPLPL